MGRIHGWIAVALGTIGAGSAGASCNLILGDREIYGEDRGCSEDADCDDDERCDEEDGDVCREACDPGAGGGAQQCLQQKLPGFRECDDSTEVCSDPTGAPCEYGEYGPETECGGGYDSCINEDADGNEVMGYCSNDCRDVDEPPRCPDGFLCSSDQNGGKCRCVGSGCLGDWEY